MSEHTLWKGITPMPTPEAREIQMAYVDGYCLALEDLLEELERLQQIQMEHVAREEQAWAQVVPAVYRPLRKWAGRNLQQARDTLKHLKEVARERATAPEA